MNVPLVEREEFHCACVGMGLSLYCIWWCSLLWKNHNEELGLRHTILNKKLYASEGLIIKQGSGIPSDIT